MIDLKYHNDLFVQKRTTKINNLLKTCILPDNITLISVNKQKKNNITKILSYLSLKIGHVKGNNS